MLAKQVGKWCTDKLPVVEIEKKYYVLHGWNGESFGKCWKAKKEPRSEVFYDYLSLDNLCIVPIYGKEYYDEENDFYQSDIIDWELRGVS
jgi:hypothetical protein